MISPIIYIGITIVVLAIFGFVGYFIYTNKKGEDPENKAQLWLFGNQYTDGHADFVIQDKKFSENRVKLTLSPRDNNYIRIQNGKDEVKNYTLFLDKRQFEFLGVSNHREIYGGYPQRITDLPESFKKSRLGQGIIKAINDGNIENHEAKVYLERIKSSENTGIKIGASKLSDLYNKTLKETLKDQSKLMKKEEKEVEKK